jgi:hypothetical protein
MKLVLQQLPSIRGDAREKLLAPDAAEALIKLERDTGGLVYTDMWRDSVASLMAKRTRRASQLPGYSSHNYGIGFDLDVKTILQEKQIRYEDLLYLLKKRGWVCHRRDGIEGAAGYDHFSFLGEHANKYLVKCTMDPITWDNPAEERIFERHGKDFHVSLYKAQELLTSIGFYNGKTSGIGDLYTREAAMAFQRAWDLIETGLVDTTTCRVLAFVTAQREVLAAPKVDASPA